MSIVREQFFRNGELRVGKENIERNDDRWGGTQKSQRTTHMNDRYQGTLGPGSYVCSKRCCVGPIK